MSRIKHIMHGTTIATNSILTYDGAKTGMITTEGYRDIIHIARHQRPQHYSIMQEVPWQVRPLVRRRHCKVVRERVKPPSGIVEVPLDQESVIRAIRELRGAGVESIAVCFLFSYLNPIHEERVRALIEEEYPEAFVSTSASIFPQFREFERFTTTAINAFVGPKVKRYINALGGSIRGGWDWRRSPPDALEWWSCNRPLSGGAAGDAPALRSSGRRSRWGMGWPPRSSAPPRHLRCRRY